MADQVKNLFEILKLKKATIGAAESCTGGLLSAEITSVSGSSAFFMGAIVSYDNSVKQKFLSVTDDDLKNHGAVSQIVAEKMAIHVRHQLNCTFGISITGIAGPGGGSKKNQLALYGSASVAPSLYIQKSNSSQVTEIKFEKVLSSMP